MTATDHNGQAFEPGAMAVAKVLARMEFKPTADQSKKLWDEIQSTMESWGDLWPEGLQEILDSRDGGLDTLPRNYLMDALGDTVVGMPWPVNGDLKETKRKFREGFADAMNERGIQSTRRINSDMSPSGL